MSFIASYSLDLLNYVYCLESLEAGISKDDVQMPPPVKLKDLAPKLVVFSSALATYGIDNSDFKKIYLEVPDLSMSPENEEQIKGMYNQSEIDPLETIFISGITLNPIYHFRMMVAEWQIKRYNANKDKKRLLELRLLHLQMSNGQEPSEAINKEIKYLKSRIDGLDKDLENVEKDLGV
jgi:hypothetical protein